MGLFEVIFIFIISWWMILFMALPFKAKAAENPGQSEYHSAPERTYLKPKLIITTVLAFIVTLVLAVLIKKGMIALWLPYRF